jgi:hypothetical protein
MESKASVRRRAIRWCGNLAGWFPFLRPGAEALARAEDVAASLGPNDGEVPTVHIRAVRDLVSEDERDGLVESFAREQEREWAVVCADAGDVEALAEALTAGAVSARSWNAAFRP